MQCTAKDCWRGEIFLSSSCWPSVEHNRLSQSCMHLSKCINGAASKIIAFLNFPLIKHIDKSIRSRDIRFYHTTIVNDGLLRLEIHRDMYDII